MIKIDQAFTVDAPLEEIWDFLMDAPRVGKCMPGVDSVECVGEDKYAVKLTVKIGPIKALFSGYVIIESAVPMESMQILVDWKDKTTTSTTKVTGTIAITQEAADCYQIRVAGEATVLGALSKYGQGIANKMAGQYAGQFAENMQAELH